MSFNTFPELKEHLSKIGFYERFDFLNGFTYQQLIKYFEIVFFTQQISKELLIAVIIWCVYIEPIEENIIRDTRVHMCFIDGNNQKARFNNQSLEDLFNQTSNNPILTNDEYELMKSVFSFPHQRQYI
jgi:hypothetical protein